MENLRPPPSTGVNASETVGASPELLCQIFAHADDSDLAVCSEICRTWQSAAMTVRWRVVLDPVALFSILAPMIARGPNQLYTFSQPIGPSDWKRFEKYGRCVRVLWHGRLSPWDEHRGLHTSAFAAIASTRTALNFLPLLATFRWGDDANLAFLPMFLHPNITRFQLTFNSFHDTRFANGLHAVAVRMPHLTELTIQLQHGNDADVTTLGEPTLFELLSAYPNLRTLAIPSSHASERILETICSLDHLVSLRIGNNNARSDERRSISSPASIAPEGDQGNSTLRHLECVDADFAILLKYLESLSHFHSLTTLIATTSTIESPRTLENIFRLIGEKCPSLVNIFITPEVVPASPDELHLIANAPERRITFKTLHPLTALHHLESFDLAWYSPVWLNDKDFKEFISNFPKLRQLLLNSHPKSDLDTPPLSLGAVRSLVKHCPEIESFELFLDATAHIPSDPDFDCSTENMYPFYRRIQSVGFGLSNISDPVKTAITLTSMMSIATPYLGPDPMIEEDPEAVRRLEAWEQVYRDLRIYQNIWREERTRVVNWLCELRTENRPRKGETPAVDP